MTSVLMNRIGIGIPNYNMVVTNCHLAFVITFEMIGIMAKTLIVHVACAAVDRIQHKYNTKSCWILES